MGGNRVQLNPGGDENLAVPVLEFYQPPYFFKKAARPIIAKAPEQIHMGSQFKLDVSEAGGEGGTIAAVALLRTGPITHNWTRGNQYIKLPFTQEQTANCVLRPRRCQGWRSRGTTCCSSSIRMASRAPASTCG